MGSAVPILEGIRVAAGGMGTLGFSQSGTLAYVPGVAAAERRTLVWVDRQQVVEQPTSCPSSRMYGLPRLSPDGNFARFDVQRRRPAESAVARDDLLPKPRG